MVASQHVLDLILHPFSAPTGAERGVQAHWEREPADSCCYPMLKTEEICACKTESLQLEHASGAL